MGDQAFGVFLCYVVPAASCPRGRRIAVLQHGVKQRKLVGVAAAIPRPYAAAAKLDRVQNTRSVGCPCAIPQHPAVCLLNFKLIFGGYAGIVRISVVGGIRKAQAQPVGAGNWFVHDGQAQGNAFGNASATGIENKIPIGTCVCYGRAAGIVVRGRTAADRVTSQFSVFEALTAQDQVAAAGDFGVFFHLRGKPVHRCFQVGVLAGQVAGLYFQAVHAGLDLQHLAGQVLVALAVHGTGTFPAGAAHALKACLARGDCGAHQVGVKLPPACVLNVHDLPAGKAGAAGHRYFAGGVGHVFQHVVQVLDNAFQVGFGAGCQQQIALHCISVGGGGAVGVDDSHVTVRLPDLDFFNGLDRVVLVAQAVSIIGGAAAGTVRGDFDSAALIGVGQELQLAVRVHVGIAASRFRRPGDDLSAGQVVRVERLHAVAAIDGQAAAGKRDPRPLAGQLNQLPDSFGELCLIGVQPAGKVRIQLGHGVIGRDLVAVALGAGGLFSIENTHLGAAPGIVLPVVGQGIPGSDL